MLFRSLGGEFSMLSSFGSDEPHKDRLTAGLGRRFEIMSTSLKRHPSCGRSHAPIDALLEVLSRDRISPQDIESIEVEVAHSAAPTIDARPQLTHNIQYLMAVTAVAGTFGQAQLRPEWSGREDVRALAGRVTVSGTDAFESTFPGRKGGAVTVTTATARHRESLPGPHGDPNHPLTDDERHAKFASLAGTMRTASQVEWLWDILDELDRQESITALMSGLAG